MPFSKNPFNQLIPGRVTSVLKRLKSNFWSKSIELKVHGSLLLADPIKVEQATQLDFKPVIPGEYFGKPGGSFEQRWFKLDIPPAEKEEIGKRVLVWNCQGETTLYIKNNPWAGLDPMHEFCPIPDSGETLYLDCGTYQAGLFVPGGRIKHYDRLRFLKASINTRNSDFQTLYYDLDVLKNVMHLFLDESNIKTQLFVGHAPMLQTSTPLLRMLLRKLEKICDLADQQKWRDLKEYVKSVYQELSPSLFQGKASLIGHSHLDLVWLWPESVTKNKALHTFVNQLRLMERYKDFKFVQSQIYLYTHIEKNHKEVYQEILQRIKEKRWEVTGGFYVEADVNLSSGESLARSLLYAQQEFKKLNGKYSRLVWLPDVFGYPVCLPDILHLGGIEYFYTTKMTWSAINKFPYTSFVWRGNGGAHIITQLCPVDYNGKVEIKQIRLAIAENKQADVFDNLILPTGFGDGGGGTTEEMCEYAKRLKNLAGTPACEWKFTEEVFDELALQKEMLPVYEGELYLEYHRGTYTTQGNFKHLFKVAERMLLAHEALRVMTDGGKLDFSAWERLLFSQFHDALPGSSINIVYKELEHDLENVIEKEKKEIEKELQYTNTDTKAVVNPCPYGRRIILDKDTFVDLSAYSSKAIEPNKQHASSNIKATNQLLDNGILSVTFNKKGMLECMQNNNKILKIVSTYFMLYPDNPTNFDAWDIDRHSLCLGEKLLLSFSLQVKEHGKARALLSGTSKLGENSSIEIRYILEAGNDMLLMEMEINWKESHKLLKYHIETEYTGKSARYGAPFGSIKRSQKPGLLYDEAQWEVPGQRWVAVSDDAETEGIALITESKYGFSCRDGNLGLSLLRSPKDPDQEADIRKHIIRFAIGEYVPETKNARLSTQALAEILYTPYFIGNFSPDLKAPFEILEPSSLVIAGLKPAESGFGYIIRIHETIGKSGKSRLLINKTEAVITQTNFLEERIGKSMTVNDGFYILNYKPYQIISLHIQ